MAKPLNRMQRGFPIVSAAKNPPSLEMILHDDVDGGSGFKLDFVSHKSI